MSEFKSKRKNHILQPDEMVEVMFELVCMLAKDKKLVEYEQIKEEWNKEK